MIHWDKQSTYLILKPPHHYSFRLYKIKILRVNKCFLKSEFILPKPYLFDKPHF